MKFIDSHGNVHVRLVDRHSIISYFFGSSNCMDKHNQARQHEYALKKWDTRDPYFRLAKLFQKIHVSASILWQSTKWVRNIRNQGGVSHAKNLLSYNHAQIQFRVFLY